MAGSLWSVEESERAEMASELARAGLRRLHWDMSDGVFAAPGGFDAKTAERLAMAAGLRNEAHLMAVDPRREVDAWTDFCDRVFVHVEAEGWEAAVDRVVARGSEPGLAVSPGTAVDGLPDGVSILCMTIVPGQAGSAFSDPLLAKAVRLAADGTRSVGIDGGVQTAHAARAEEAGIGWVVVGTDLIAPGGLARWAPRLAPAI
ncbi:hypothetical protein ACFSBZ_10390 [Amnibacterium flavum]|uniref:hypothetical protein n=1 Tax=Amnibacterium flavum TaxID=2173173 RepID=UPI001402367D|nr:hypothetical protein [Amnibacterium flavum]